MNRRNMGVGSLTVIMMFVILCLTIFCILALITADRDRKLTDKNMTSITSFYEADSKAQKILSEIDGILLDNQKIMNQGSMIERINNLFEDIREAKGKAWENEQGKIIVNYQIRVSENQLLSVELESLHGAEDRYAILGWALKLDEDWEYKMEQNELNDKIVEE